MKKRTDFSKLAYVKPVKNLKKEKLTLADALLVGYGFKVVLVAVESVMGRKLTKKELKETKEKYIKELTEGNIIK